MKLLQLKPVICESDRQKILGILGLKGEYNTFRAFLEYCKIKGILYKPIKVKHFCPDGHSNCFHPYTDIPLSKGYVLASFRFGFSHGYLYRVSQNLRRLDLDHLRSDGFL
jgi:hypothetical protein